MMMGAVMTDDEDDDDEEEGVKELIGMNKGWPNFTVLIIYILELNPGIESYNSTQTQCRHHIRRCFVNLFQKFLL